MAEVLGRYLAAGDVEHATFTHLVLLSLSAFFWPLSCVCLGCLVLSLALLRSRWDGMVCRGRGLGLGLGGRGGEGEGEWGRRSALLSSVLFRGSASASVHH
jgi:hypothetical protein